MSREKIIIVGAGYVGMAYAVLFGRSGNQFAVDVVDTDEKKLKQLRRGQSPVNETAIETFVKGKPKNVTYTNKIDINEHTAAVFVCVPTSYDKETEMLDTAIVRFVLDSIDTTSIPIVIKSTVPVGFTQKYIDETDKRNVVFSPEFLREGSSVIDVLLPSRVVIGTVEDVWFEQVWCLLTRTDQVCDVHYPMSPSEAEAVKLFSNTYLALRVAFFNELDTYAMKEDLDAKAVISAVSMDKRIGHYYNNPSFGYGGYCLPKDVKQLERLTSSYFSPVIHSINVSNMRRKHAIVSKLVSEQVKCVGVFDVGMKSGSDNYRDSAILEIISELKALGMYVISYERVDIPGVTVISNFNKFSKKADVILANRYAPILDKVKDKVLTRDVFGKDI